MESTMKTTMVLLSVCAVVLAGSPDFTNKLNTCSGDADVVSCLKLRAVRLLDNALATDSLSISDFVAVVKDPKKQQVETEQDARYLQSNNTDLDEVLMDKVQKYFETRTIQLRMPEDVLEGRRRKGGMKKGGGTFLMMFAGLGAFLLQLALATIAALSGKALIVSKIALLIAALFGFKSLTSQQHQSHSANVVYSEPDHHQAGWGRSAYSQDVAQDLAYNGHKENHRSH